jgi:glycopeptide antibiotics resistance protein
LYAFSLLSIIGIFTYKNSKKLNFLNIYLVLLSIILEILHIFIPVRSFEFPDLFGNLLGVLIILMINFFYKKYENLEN